MMPPTTISRCFRLPVLLALLCVFPGACQERPHSLPGIPVLTSPAPDTKTYSPAPSLRWDPVDGAEDYLVQLANDSDFTQGSIQDRTPIERFVAGRGLEPGTYYWRVAAVAGGKTGSYSEVSTFTVRAHEKIFKVPADADLNAIQRIVREAAAQAPARVEFAKEAVYRVAPDRQVIRLSGISDLEIDGNGSTFVITNPTAGFIHLNRCQRVIMRNFVIDYDPLPFAIGTVQSVDSAGGTFTLRADPGMPEFDATHIRESWMFGVTLDASTPGRMKTGSALVVSAGPALSLSREGDLVTIPLASKDVLATFAPGDKYVQFARKNAAELVTGEDSHELVFLDNTTYAAPACHYALLRCDDAKVLRSRQLIRSGRWFGGNADGVHVRSSRIGPWVEGCTFEGIGDDGVAIYSKGIVILEKPSDTTLRLDLGFFTLDMDSSFLIFDPTTGAPVAEDLTVKSVTDVPASEQFPAHKLVEFSPGFGGEISTPFTKAPAGNHETARERHEQQIKDAWKHLQVFDRTAQHQHFMVRRNIMKQVRRFGVIIRAENGAVEENEFTQTSDAAITLHNEPYFWRNGLQSKNILIQNNTIKDCNFLLHPKVPGTINVLLRSLTTADRGKTWKDRPTEWRGHHGITIRGNTISEWRRNAIWVQSTEEVEISGNRIEAPLVTPDGNASQVAIHLENVINASVAGNTVEASPFLAEQLREIDCRDVKVAP